MNKHLNEFLSLRCAGDVINAVTPVNNMAKEITEAMAIRRVLRKIVLPEPQKYTVLDLCAGNALVGVVAVFTLPILACNAYDKRPRRRTGFKNLRVVKRWHYFNADIFKDKLDIPDDSILVASHPCGKLAKRIIELYNESDTAHALVILPCCIETGTLRDFPCLLTEQSGLNKYDLWSYALYEACSGGKRGVFKDSNILSPANNVVWATKGGRI